MASSSLIAVPVAGLLLLLLATVARASPHFGEHRANALHHPALAGAKDSWDVDNSADDIRCFCNMPKCITTGYMCRTARNRHGGCYWEQALDGSESLRDSRHGCLELLKDEYAEPKCNATATRPGRSAAIVRLHCCHEDMCNHVDRPAPNVPTHPHRHEQQPLLVLAAEPHRSGGIPMGAESPAVLSSTGALAVRPGQTDQADQTDSAGVSMPTNAHINRSSAPILARPTNANGDAPAFGESSKTLADAAGQPPATADTAHRSSPAIAVQFEKQLLFDYGTGVGVLPAQHPHQRVTIEPSSGMVRSWFRTANIAFPIGGAIILFALIALAIRILRTDIDASPDQPHHSHQRACQLQLQHNRYAEKTAANKSRFGGPSISGGGDCSSFDDPYTINAQHQHLLHIQQMQQQQLALHNNYRKASGGLTMAPASLIANDLRAAGSKAKTFEYTLLGQHEPIAGALIGHPHKATNQAAAMAAAVAVAAGGQTHAHANNVNLRCKSPAALSLGGGSSTETGDGHSYKLYEKDTLGTNPYWTSG